ncbi:hypothetical protein D1823_01650 [Ruegeria sp. AD91A]|nr:hypothetical protein D1823_01650 [Ruegeria sp. AD91A]
MASLMHPMRTRQQGHQTTPTKNNQVSYRHLAFINQEIRRAGEQTSPQVARAAGHPAKRVNAAG